MRVFLGVRRICVYEKIHSKYYQPFPFFKVQSLLNVNCQVVFFLIRNFILNIDAVVVSGQKHQPDILLLDTPTLDQSTKFSIGNLIHLSISTNDDRVA